MFRTLKRLLLLLISLSLLTAPAWGADYWCYVRTYDRPEVSVSETGGRSKKGDIVQVLDASIYKTPSEIEKKEWLIIKVSGLTQTQIDLMMTSWVDDTDKEKPITKAYRQYKLDLDILRKNANIKIETGEFKTKLIPAIIIPLISQKTELDIASYKLQSYKYAYIDKPLLITMNKIVPRAWATTTNTFTVIPAGGGDYATLSAWEDARDGNLVTSDFIEIANCSGATADTTVVAISGWTTDTTHYIEINGDNTSGKWNTSAYRLEITENNPALSNITNYIRFTNLQVKMISTSNYGSRHIVDNTPAGAHDTLFSKCIFWSSDASTYTNRQGVYLNWAGGTGTVTIQNCEIYRNGGAATEDAIYINQYGTANIYNCTIVGNWSRGINRSDGTVVAKNCYVATTSGTSYYGAITQTTCASSDTTATGTALDNIAYSTDNFVNVTAGSEDLHLVVGSALINVGTDLSAVFTTDIDGITRGATWDIGADEYVAAGGETYFPIWLYENDGD